MIEPQFLACNQCLAVVLASDQRGHIDWHTEQKEVTDGLIKAITNLQGKVC